MELSLDPVFRRGHGALYDALVCGGVDEERLRRLLAGELPAGAPLMLGIDATTFPRPNAECSPDRGLDYAPCRCDGDRKVVPGRQFQWVMGLERGSSSWTLAVDARRLPDGGRPVPATASQIRDLAGRLDRRQRDAGRPAVVSVHGAAVRAPAVGQPLDADLDYRARSPAMRTTTSWGTSPIGDDYARAIWGDEPMTEDQRRAPPRRTRPAHRRRRPLRPQPPRPNAPRSRPPPTSPTPSASSQTPGPTRPPGQLLDQLTRAERSRDSVKLPKGAPYRLTDSVDVLCLESR